MKKLLLISIVFFSVLALYGQNGLTSGNLFLLSKDQKTISINSFENNRIKELKTFSISEKSIYTTDQQARVAILDTAKNHVTLFNLNNSEEIKLTIPYTIKPKSILLADNNLFVGGEMGKEMLVQYHIENKKWYQLEITNEIAVWGKAIDDLVVNDSLLIAIDNIVIPKYILYYRLNPTGKLNLSGYDQLKHNGAYESIHKGRITQKYFGLLSTTSSGYVGVTNHITIYKNLNLKSSFAISSNQSDKDYQTFNEFLIIKDKVIIASKEKGLGIFEIKNSYFKKPTEFQDNRQNPRESPAKIRYTKYENLVITNLTLIPYTNKFIITLENSEGKFNYEIMEIQ
jgi:hypothetical protein